MVGLMKKNRVLMTSARLMRQLIIIGTAFISYSCHFNGDDRDSFITEDPKSYNERIMKGKLDSQQWADDPVLIVRELFRSGDFERKIIIDVDGKSKDEVTITFTREGLEDDSVNGEKRILEYKKINDVWTIESIRLGFKCWKERGHTNYSGNLCS